MDALELLNKYGFVNKTDVLDSRTWKEGFYYKIKITFVDNSVLFATEYFDEMKRKYSFHWQKQNGKLISRWDNTPHHKKIPTFPHHKHLSSGTITGSSEISLKEILNEIEKKFQKHPD